MIQSNYLKEKTAKRRRAQVRVYIFLSLLAVVGCKEEEGIRSYQAPKPEQSQFLPEAQPKRLFVVILPHEDQAFFFKLTGPVKLIAENQEKLFQFLDSVRFKDGEKDPTWKLPDGWNEGAARANRLATILFGPDKQQAELSIQALGRDYGSLRANVNRWRLQIGLGPITDAELDQYLSKRKVAGVETTVVDMSQPTPG